MTFKASLSQHDDNIQIISIKYLPQMGSNKIITKYSSFIIVSKRISFLKLSPCLLRNEYCVPSEFLGKTQ